MSDSIKNWIAGSPEKNVKELKWQLMGMGIYLDETKIQSILDQILREECKCPDDSGSCNPCMELYATK